MVVVGRHPACDARLDSLRVSRHHCCMMQENGEVVVRDLGSTNGIRINGQRVEMGRLKANDELSIAHIRYRLDTGQGHDQTLADGGPYSPTPPPVAGPRIPVSGSGDSGRSGVNSLSDDPFPLSPVPPEENALAAAVRRILPSSVAEKCRIQVIVQMTGDPSSGNGTAAAPPSGPEAGPEPEKPTG
ncbi:Glycogen accumulation regulator GarA [Aquisphaera giovannonii]|uniref:Glycogen accumulation regulator GarA n=2 Tax=Aquisphaera giovannonii TaxID=406548 RepID=A0A5B9WDK4_9BACT|nr:Glycogen accumulation regulator GarA [Aquisphaera giovannonii]